MDAFEIMEILTCVVTIGMFMTGIPPCLTMYETKSTRNVPYPIFLLNAVSCLGMVHYGLIHNDWIIILLNGIGCFLQSFYAFLFLTIVKPKTFPLLLLMIALIFDAVLYTYLYTVLDNDAARADKLGMTSMLITTFVYCLPIHEVINNVRHKNADGVPCIMLIGVIISCSCWLVYGIMLADPIIYIPNIPGIIVAGVKLSLHFLYGSETQNQNENQNRNQKDKKS